MLSTNGEHKQKIFTLIQESTKIDSIIIAVYTITRSGCKEMYVVEPLAGKQNYI